MKLWDKGQPLDKRIEDFTVGNDRILDLQLAKFDIQGSKAHTQMLESIGMITKEEHDSLHKALDKLSETVEAGEFVIEDGIEDVHSQVELILTRDLGDIGKKIHLGRSRNDQVLLDLRLFFRAKLTELCTSLESTIQGLISGARNHGDILMPGYTHMQVGMVSSFGMWFSGFAEAFTDDMAYIQSTIESINRNPLGTAAGYGSSIPLDREMTTNILNFEGLCLNPINAQIGRGKTELMVANCLSSVAITMNKMAMDLCLYSNENFRFFSLPDKFTTGSSIMPHKKNPDVFELIRAQSNLLMSLPAQVNGVISNLTTGYHRDFQILKDLIFPAIQKCNEMLDLITLSMKELIVNEVDLLEDKYKYLFSVELVNNHVKEGMSFREAYKLIGKMIDEGSYVPSTDIHHTHLGSIGNLGIELLEDRLAELSHKTSEYSSLFQK